MQLLAMLGTLAFILVGAIVGARMLLLARRTRELPEFLLGLGLFTYAIVAQPAVVASQALGAAFGRQVQLSAIGVGLGANSVAIICIYVFTWAVFRRGSRIGFGALLAGAALAVGASTTVMFSISASEAGATYSPMTKLALGGLVLNFAAVMSWTAIESLAYRTKLRRRLSLGLADPVLINRFALWGVGCLAAAASALVVLGSVAAGLNVASHPLPMLATAFSGMTIATCWSLSFLPPTAYLDWLRRHEVATTA